MHLLIEPVWNRNLDTVSESTTETKLLIEPVWNRNEILGWNRITERLAFNRTSMESKQSSESCGLNVTSTFNRTSMESKHALDGVSNWS